MFEATTVTAKGSYSRISGRKLAEQLIRSLGCEPDVCWLFCAPGDGLEDLLRGIRETVRTERIVGCTTDGEISQFGVTKNSAVLGGIATDQMDFHLAVAENIGCDSRRAGTRLGQQLPSGTGYVQLFSDGITGNGSELLQGIGAVLGPEIPIAGGTAGDNGCFLRTWQFAGKRILHDAAVAVAFTGNFAVGTGVKSGWMPIGLAKTVTRSEGNVLYQLNGEPALRVYQRFLGKHAEKLPAIGVEYPLGLMGSLGNMEKPDYFLLRATMSVDREEESIRFAGDIPEGATVNLTCGDTASILKAASDAGRQAQNRLAGRTPVMTFCYSCMARKIVLGRKTRQEIERLVEATHSDLPLIGFYTYGEYCPIRPGGPSYLHNETITVSILGI